jgi:hypothetical protein
MVIKEKSRLEQILDWHHDGLSLTIDQEKELCAMAERMKKALEDIQKLGPWVSSCRCCDSDKFDKALDIADETLMTL